MEQDTPKVQGLKVETSFAGLIRRYVSASGLLIIATVLALIFANLPATREGYAWLWQQPVSLSIGSFNVFSHGGHAMTLMDLINDFLMFFFFLSVGLEIKREVLCGELSTRQKALLPIIGACGGMLMPVIVFYCVCYGHPLMERGCAIPMATDIAFSLGVLSMFSKRVPVGLKIFLAALAVADDLGGIIVIALFYSEGLAWKYLLGAALIVAALLIGNKRDVRLKAFYMSLGMVLWYMVLNSGIHATIAGVVLAFCIPANLTKGTRYYAQRIRKLVNRYPEIDVTEADKNRAIVIDKGELQILRRIESAADKLISPLQDIEDQLAMPINYVVIPLFAFANAGVDFAGMSIGSLFHGVALGVFLGLLIGKFTGVLSFSWLSMKLCVCQMPAGANWKSFASVCMLCGIGFTVSMFIAALSYPTHLGADAADMLNEAKLGILCGTVASALVGSFMLHYTLPRES
ncbi:MAG: Na+/H+ antiporter NhaA [Bacteroidaceae bacterium]|nr:Na+/H+ antiporter NhaA [Bacteroidaceae bacterium]